MPGAMKLRMRDAWAEYREIRFYELDAADLDRQCAPFARAQAGMDLFLWFWFRPDITPRVGDRWDRLPGVPFIQPPRRGETLDLNGVRYLVVRAERMRMDNYGWTVVRKIH